MKRILLLTVLFACQAFPGWGDWSPLEDRVAGLEFSSRLRENSDLRDTWYAIGFQNGIAATITAAVVAGVIGMALYEFINYTVEQSLKQQQAKQAGTAAPSSDDQQDDDKS